MMSAVLDEFIERARVVSIEGAAPLLGLKFSGKRFEHPQPCPVCGGTDTFSFNVAKNKWNCRSGGAGGQDAIGMAGHVLDLDLKRRATFLAACAAVTGEPVPEDGEHEDAAERAARLKRLEDLRMRHYEEIAARQAVQTDYREKERAKARGIYKSALRLVDGNIDSGRKYLAARGCGVPRDRWLRTALAVPYWHGQDERGSPLELHSGPAMIAPFIGPDGRLIGCHITWIDLRAGPKFRPVLFGLTKDGREAGRTEWAKAMGAPALADLDAGFYERLATKKMRGTKKGGIIPLAGDPSAARWLGAEGNENTLAFGRFEGFRPDTFYFAAGDLGNLAGPAEPSSRFAHPSLTKPDKNGVERPVMIPGPVPTIHKDGEDYDAMVVPDHVEELVLLADGDSERVFTASAMARAKARHGRVGRLIPVVWPRPGTDFAAMLADLDSAYEAAE